MSTSGRYSENSHLLLFLAGGGGGKDDASLELTCGAMVLNAGSIWSRRRTYHLHPTPFIKDANSQNSAHLVFIIIL